MHYRRKLALYMPISRFRVLWGSFFIEKQKYSISNNSSNTFLKIKIGVKMALQ